MGCVIVSDAAYVVVAGHARPDRRCHSGPGRNRVTSLRAALLSTIIDTPEPGAGELCHALEQGLLDAGAGAGPAEVTRLKSRVWRLRVGSDGQARSVVLKRLDPWLGRRNELVARRWLPAIGLGDRCPHLLATVADRRGQGGGQEDGKLGHAAPGAPYPHHPRAPPAGGLYSPAPTPHPPPPAAAAGHHTTAR